MNRRIHCKGWLVAGLFLGTAYAPALASDVAPVTPLGNYKYRLTLDETFAGWPASRVWNPWLGVGANPGEEQYYLAEQVKPLPEGGLRLMAERRQAGTKAFVSAGVEGKGFLQTYGHFEVKAKIPKGQGLWSAFWLLSASHWPPEIDIFEHLGRDPNTLFFSLHSPDGRGAKSKTVDYKGADFTADYHVYAVDWRPDLLVWSVDGVERARMTENIPHEPLYPVLNLALGTEWPGPVTAATPLPSGLDVAYVRVFQFEDLPPAQPECMVIAPMRLDRDRAAKGDNVKVQGTLRVGSQALPAVKVSVILRDMFGTDYVGYQEVRLNDVEAGSSHEFAVTMKVPSDKPRQYLAAEASATAQGCQIDRRGAAQLIVDDRGR